MPESTKIDFRYAHIPQVRDFTDLMTILFPDNRNQRYAAACIYYELKWTDGLVPNMAPLETQYDLSRRTLQRARAKLARLGVIEHISNLNARYGGQSGWKLSGRFEQGLRHLAENAMGFRQVQDNSQDKDTMLLQLVDTQRSICKNTRGERI
jgi:hypothetical protein